MIIKYSSSFAATAVVLLSTITQLPTSQAFVPMAARTSVAKTSLQNLYLGDEGGSSYAPRLTVQQTQNKKHITTTLPSKDPWDAANMEHVMDKNLSELIADIESEGKKASSIKVEYAKVGESDSSSDDLQSLNRMQFQTVSQDLNDVLDTITDDAVEMVESTTSTEESKEELVVSDTSQEQFVVAEARTSFPEYNDGGNDDDGDDDDDDIPLTTLSAKDETKVKAEAKEDDVAAGRPTIVLERASPKTSKKKKTNPLEPVLGEPSDSQTKEADDWINRFFKDEGEFDASAAKEPTRSTKDATTPQVEATTDSQETSSPWDTLLQPDITSRLIDAFTPEENIRMLKEQEDVDIVKVAVSHLSKALVGGGRTAFSTFEAMFKAATSPEVVESAKDASQVVSATAQSISEALLSKASDGKKRANDAQSIAYITKEVGVAATSIGKVASAFLQSLGCTEESNDALEAASETAKECSSLLASLAALGLKQGERAQEYVSTMENNPDGPAAFSKQSLDEFIASVEAYGTKQGEVIKDSFASLEEMVATSTGMTKKQKPIRTEDNAAVMDSEASVPPEKASLDDVKASFVGFGIKQLERAEAQLLNLKNKIATLSSGTTKGKKGNIGENDVSSIPKEPSLTEKKSPLDNVMASTMEIGTKQGKTVEAQFDALKKKMTTLDLGIPDGPGGASSISIESSFQIPSSIDDIAKSVKDAFINTAKAESSATSTSSPSAEAKPIEDVMNKVKRIGDFENVFLRSFGNPAPQSKDSVVSEERTSPRSTFSIHPGGGRPQPSFTALQAKVTTASFGKKGYPGGDYDDEEKETNPKSPFRGLSSMVAFGERAQQHLAKTSRLFMQRKQNEEEESSPPRSDTKLNAKKENNKQADESVSDSQLGADEAWKAAALELEEELNLGELLAGVEIDGEALEISSLYSQATANDHNGEKAVQDASTPVVEDAKSPETNKERELVESPFFFVTTE